MHCTTCTAQYAGHAIQHSYCCTHSDWHLATVANIKNGTHSDWHPACYLPAAAVEPMPAEEVLSETIWLAVQAALNIAENTDR